MSLWLILAIALVALVIYRGSRRSAAVPIFRADIGTSDGMRFQVELDTHSFSLCIRRPTSLFMPQP